MTNIAIIDTETTGLHPDLHEVWEVALVSLTQVPDPPPELPSGHLPGNHVGLGGHHYQVERYVWQLPADLATADPFALNIGRYWERRWGSTSDLGVIDESVIGAWPPAGARCVIPFDYLEAWAHEFSARTAGAFVVGAVPSFDTQRLDALLRRHGAMPRWHYQPVCVETLVAGVLAERRRWVGEQAFTTVYQGIDPMPPWDSDALTVAMGIHPALYADVKHTALGDCDWALDLLRKAFGTVAEYDQLNTGGWPAVVNEADGVPECNRPGHEDGHHSPECWAPPPTVLGRPLPPPPA